MTGERNRFEGLAEHAYLMERYQERSGRGGRGERSSSVPVG